MSVFPLGEERCTLPRPDARSSLVLLVDDEPDHVDMYRLGLESAGFRVISANTGTEGLALARARQPAAIVLDIRLPDITGWEMCEALKKDSRTEHIPVIVLTAAATPTLARQAEAAGCAAYLLKPCFPDQLADTLRAVIAPDLRA